MKDDEWDVVRTSPATSTSLLRLIVDGQQTRYAIVVNGHVRLRCSEAKFTAECYCAWSVGSHWLAERVAAMEARVGGDRTAVTELETRVRETFGDEIEALTAELLAAEPSRIGMVLY